MPVHSVVSEPRIFRYGTGQDFTSTLEQHIHTEQTSFVGRDHLAWRGHYVLVKSVVDGDLCETSARPPRRKQSSELDRTVGGKAGAAALVTEEGDLHMYKDSTSKSLTRNQARAAN
jgi:hypothetical protein